MKPKTKSLIALYFANGLVYGFNALYFCFIQLYLEQYHTPVRVGILLTIGPLISIIAPLFWGIRADKAKYKNNVLLLAVLGSTVFYCLIALNQSFWWLFVILTVLMFFMSPFGGLIDTITLEYTSQEHISYGPPRLMGTLVFGILPMILTLFTEKNINIIFIAYPIAAIIGIISIINMPKIKGYAGKAKKINILPLFKNTKLMIIFVILAITMFSWTYYNNFFPTYLTTKLKLPQWIWGLNVFITVLGEIPFFLMFSRIFDKLGLKKLLFFGVLFSVIRYICLSFFTSAPLLLLTGLFTGLSVTAITYCGSVFINTNISSEMKASCQTLMYATAVGIPKALAGVVGGIMTNALGVKDSMLICTALCIVALILYFVKIHKDNSKEFMPSN